MPDTLVWDVARALVCAFFAICFLQSAIDKLTDWHGNLEWLNGHFANSPFAKIVKPLLGTLTAAELLTGLSCAVAAVANFLPGLEWVHSGVLLMAMATLLMLFTGQRIAKDYAGASTIAIYFGVCLLGIVIASR